MTIRSKIIGILGPVLVLSACSSEARSMPYFEKNLDEARAVIADTENCLGVDPSKALTGTDECTNAHLALQRFEVLESQRRIKEGNDRVIKEGRLMPVVKN